MLVVVVIPLAPAVAAEAYVAGAYGGPWLGTIGGVGEADEFGGRAGSIGSGKGAPPPPPPPPTPYNNPAADTLLASRPTPTLGPTTPTAGDPPPPPLAASYAPPPLSPLPSFLPSPYEAAGNDTAAAVDREEPERLLPRDRRDATAVAAAVAAGPAAAAAAPGGAERAGRFPRPATDSRA